jgi:hypothetical protein
METKNSNGQVKRKLDRNYYFIVYYCDIMCFIDTDSQRVSDVIRLSVPRKINIDCNCPNDKNPA